MAFAIVKVPRYTSPQTHILSMNAATILGLWCRVSFSPGEFGYIIGSLLCWFAGVGLSSRFLQVCWAQLTKFLIPWLLGKQFFTL